MKALDLQGLILLVQKALSLPEGSVRLSNEAFPSGNEPYVTIEQHTDIRTTSTATKFDPIKEITTLTTSKNTTLSVNAYGANAFALLNKLRDLLSAAPMIKSGLRKLGLGALSFSAVRDISAWAPPSFEHRAVFEVELLYVHKINVDTKRLERIDININGIECSVGID